MRKTGLIYYCYRLAVVTWSLVWMVFVFFLFETISLKVASLTNRVALELFGTQYKAGVGLDSRAQSLCETGEAR